MPDVAPPPVSAGLLDVRKGEWKSVLLAFAWFFFLMAAYNLLRPIRETFATDLGSATTARLFIVVFITMILAVPVFAVLVKRFSRRVLVLVVFHFFASHLFLFGLVSGTPLDGPLFRSTFFVWVSVFIMFVVSLLWSVLADTFNSEQARRLFGPIASGATVGSLAGSGFTSLVTTTIGIRSQFFLACGLLECSLLFALLLQRAVAASVKTVEVPGTAIDGNASLEEKPLTNGKPDGPFSDLAGGLIQIGKSRYLQMICVYILLAQVFGTFVYFLLNDTVKLHIEIPEARTAHFGKINFAAQAGTLVVQTLIVGQVVRRLGVSAALMVLPIVSLICITVVGVSPTLLAVSAVDVLNRIASYGMTVPAKEMLFTVVGKEAKYKSKSFIDTVVVRGSDALSGNLYGIIPKPALLKVLVFAVVPLVLVNAGVGWWLGRKRNAKTQD